MSASAARALPAVPALIALLALGLCGCGVGAGRAPSAVELTVSSEFGARLLRTFKAPQVHGEETVMSLLVRNARVGTRYGGGFVQSVDGLAGGTQGGHPVDWFYYVNGIEAPLGAASTRVHPGDHIWWDRHDWSQTQDIPAVVGSFPEPFLNGASGKRLPVRVECASPSGYACRTVTSRLREFGVPAAVAGLGSGSAAAILRVIVARFKEASADPTVAAIAGGPVSSGVYARFSADGSKLTLLDEDGRPVASYGKAAGLIAATSRSHAIPVWAVTGTDASGVEGAARAFTDSTLHDRFAVAVTGARSVLALPRVGR
jgi:hypothetical protein